MPQGRIITNRACGTTRAQRGLVPTTISTTPLRHQQTVLLLRSRSTTGSIANIRFVGQISFRCFRHVSSDNGFCWHRVAPGMFQQPGIFVDAFSPHGRRLSSIAAFLPPVANVHRGLLTASVFVCRGDLTVPAYVFLLETATPARSCSERQSLVRSPARFIVATQNPTTSTFAAVGGHRRRLAAARRWFPAGNYVRSSTKLS